MAEVVGLPGIAARTFEPDAEVVEFLELLLAQAKAGDIVGIAVATIGPQESMGTGWKGNASIRTTAAAVGLLHHRFFAAWNSHEGDTIPEAS